MRNKKNLLSSNFCGSLFVVYTEDFYMVFNNCQKYLSDCNCSEVEKYKNLFNLLFNRN